MGYEALNWDGISSLQCPLQVTKLILENSAKNVNQTGDFYLLFSSEISFGSLLTEKIEI